MTTRTIHLGSRLAATAALSLALAGGLSACGGGDSNDGATADPASPAPSATAGVDTGTGEDFVAAGNGVCETVYPQINAVAATLDPSDPAAGDAVTSDFLPAVQDLQDQLNTLTPTDDVADAFAQVMDEQQANLDAITDDPTSLFSIDPGTIDSEFDDIGLTSCGSDSGTFN